MATSSTIASDFKPMPPKAYRPDPRPKMSRTFEVGGSVGMGLTVTRTLDTINVSPQVDRSAFFSLEAAKRMYWALEALMREALTLRAKRPGEPAITHCHRCGDPVFVVAYEPHQDYWCMSTKQKSCQLDRR